MHRIQTSSDNDSWANFKILYNSTNGSSGWTEVTNLALDINRRVNDGVGGKYLNQWSFDGVEARWWKVWGTDGASTGVQSVYELEIFESKNLSDEGTPTADSQYGASYSPDKCNDLDMTTRWLSGSGAEHWCQIEWSSSKHITSVSFYCSIAGGESFSEYWIEYWNGSSWQQVIYDGSYSCSGNRTSNEVDFITTKARMRMTSDGIYTGLYELEFYGNEDTITFTFSDPSPTHQSTVYGNSQTLQLTVTVSGSDIYDATFYNATTSGIIGSTISGTNSGQSVSTNFPTLAGGDYSWYLIASISGSEDTSSTYEFTKKFKCAGYTEVDSVLTSGIPVRLYKRDTGELIGSTTSAGVSGTFEIDTIYNENHYVVAIQPTDSGTNALIYDWITP